jgi:tetratricopeptide (TPR) repeat protein
LEAGQFDRAQDLARAAEASNPSGRWGLFEDTPQALLKDVQAAIAKSQKKEAEQLLRQAKALLSQPARSDREKAELLDRALQLAQRAEQLHGPYSIWDFGDRPDKVIRQIQATRARLNVPAMAPPGLPHGVTTASGGPGQTTPAVQPATKTTASHPASNRPAATTAPLATDSKKAAAQRLLAEGKQLAEAGQFAAAKARFLEADRLGASFAPQEYSPAFALQDLNVRGQRTIDQLLAQARTHMNKNETAAAETALQRAAEIAQQLGLHSRPIEELRAQLRSKSSTSGRDGVASSGTVPSPTLPQAPVPPAPLSASNATQPSASNATQPSGGLSARQLLDQAAVEFSAGRLDIAEQLALRAHNHPEGGLHNEARALLNSIDAERLAQKKINALRSLEAAETATRQRDYNQALGVLLLIDPNHLPSDKKARREELLTLCRTELEKNTVAVAGSQTPALPSPTSPETSQPKNPDSVVTQTDALRQVQFQKLRSEGLKVQAEATKAFGNGETDLAIQMLQDYIQKVRASELDPSSITLLLRPIESRLDTFRVMKGQTDAIARQQRENREARELIAGRVAAEEQRKAEITQLVRRYHELVRRADFSEAEKVALQAKQLDPDNPALAQLVYMAKMSKRVRDAEKLKSDKEQFVLDALNKAEQPGPFVDVDNPVAVKLEAYRRARNRGSLDDAYLRTRSEAEYDIELKLNKPIEIEFTQTPINQAIENLKTLIGVPILLDEAALEAEGLSPVKPVTVKPGYPVAAKHLLSFTLEQAGLSYVIENDMVKVTTTRKAKGRLYTKVFAVADLVTPIPNFAMPDYANVDKMFAQSGAKAQIGSSGLPTPLNPPGGLGGGLPASMTAGLQPGIHGGVPLSQAGRLESQWQQSGGPVSASAPVTTEQNSRHEQLIQLITSLIKPHSWDGMGGAGRIQYYDVSSALVVNQTADVIREVEDLLEALRRLQDLALAVEVRIVSVSESWFERLGLDFSMNIKTHTTQFEPQLTAVDPNTGFSGVFRPVPFINDINARGVTVGLTPAGTFTPDLDVPIRPRNFQMAVPPFGGYPNMPGNNGGIALGLAFLNDIQVYMFMEAAQGDRRVNVMQAPKLTLFNGQTATLTVSNLQFFVTNVQVISVNGQLVFVPQNTPFPGPGDFNQGGIVSITIQGVVSADRRFVRLNMPITMSAQTGANVPLFPFTTFVIPVFEGGSQGQPVPFTQFLQQPAFTTLNINTTVVCPDGGTVLLGGFKQVSEGRNEFGPPVLSKVPYLNRLFKNVGIGRETTHIMIMVTPRIIINSEEEIFQTEGRPPLGQ